MISQEDIERIKFQIGNGNTDRAINTLYLRLPVDSPYWDEVVQLSGRWKEISRQVRQGVIDNPSSTIIKNQISKGVIDLVNKMTSNFSEEEEEEKREKTGKGKVVVFISYAPEDKEFLENLKSLFRPLERKEKVQIWFDESIEAGTILKHLENSDMILLLISNDYFANDGCDYEMGIAKQQKENDENIKVFPIILRKCSRWTRDEFLKSLTVLPKNGKWIKSFEDKDEAWDYIIETIEPVINSMLEPEQ